MMNNYEATLFKDKQIGFFIYLFVEAIMFLTLFATYLVFTPSSEGPHPSKVFEAKSVIISSIFLLSSSGTLWLAERGLKDRQLKKLLPWLAITLLFGLIFLGLEIREFSKYVGEGYTLSTSSFLSSYYVLVGLHASHVAFGCAWMTILFIQLKRAIPYSLYIEKFKTFSYYWHFVDVIWVFILLIVYVRYLI
ncbi:cytochrome c oxidase subunit 3 [Virgibacillus halodenitrificans]|uniref:cytochrome c oxidase subunit 3 n=1 Tax=Virgibacillus halodenitrificans TaxID=1482 RepID=UPI002DB8F7BB|nr:cytochrome c oxidase subunit 3 [Virgibacillus halodenitrificans]MEC2160950.1 cytochrome c oxidase subunit 3 [Virgibacillus halodenitrificans]